MRELSNGFVNVDHARMRAERRARLRAAMAAQGVDALVLVGPTNAEYAGVRQPCADAMRMHYEPVVAIFGVNDPVHVCTRFAEGVSNGDEIAPPLPIETPAGVRALAARVRELVGSGARVGVDEYTSAMLDGLATELAGIELVDASMVTGAARITKTADEVECLREAQRINEAAMYDVERALVPGVRQNELTAIFLRRIFELGATANIIDPIWSITPRSIAEATHTANADVGFPLASDDRFLREGDLILSDTGMTFNGYHSDFGKTWICSLDPRPSPALRDCYRQWQAVFAEVTSVLRPGVSCGDLVRAAQRVEQKYGLSHFYLGHGVGVDSAEMPFIGSDLGIAFDDTIELTAGMTFVLEPVVWRDGVGGYRSEELVVVTDDGFERLSRYGYSPFD
jgi:Xaa-Pro dipeptidase